MKNDDFNLDGLSEKTKRRYIGMCRLLQIREYFYTPPPISFSLRVSILIFIFLAILPLHPLTIPTAIGGALSIVLLFSL